MQLVSHIAGKFPIFCLYSRGSGHPPARSPREGHKRWRRTFLPKQKDNRGASRRCLSTGGCRESPAFRSDIANRKFGSACAKGARWFRSPSEASSILVGSTVLSVIYEGKRSVIARRIFFYTRRYSKGFPAILWVVFSKAFANLTPNLFAFWLYQCRAADKSW